MCKMLRQGKTRDLQSNIVYACIGTRLCRAVFPHLVPLHEDTIARHVSKVVNGHGYDVYDSSHSKVTKTA